MITTQELINKVRYLINETDADAGVSLITDDMRSINDTIIKLLPQAVAIVQKQSNGKYVNVKNILPSNITLYDSNDGFKAILLPTDFANLVSIRLNSWKTPCVEISLPDSVEVRYKFSGNASALSLRPVCVEEFSSSGERMLKLFPANSSDRLNHFVYEAQFNAAYGLNTCDKRMADAVSYVCTALLYNVFERYDAAKIFMSFATALCGE